MASKQVQGTFAVKIEPVVREGDETVASGRLKLLKTYAGDLVGTSTGEMWSVDTSVQGSGGYVAIERVSCTLEGRDGSFALLHQGTMRRGGDFQMRLVVVPDSGTEELEGLSGTMSIRISGRDHFYEFQYELPAGR